MLFALLAAFAPVLGAPYSGNEFQDNLAREYVSAPDNPFGGAASPVRAAFNIAEDIEEEADEDEGDSAIFLALAALDPAPDAEYQAGDAWFPTFRRPSAHFGTGPPIL